MKTADNKDNAPQSDVEKSLEGLTHAVSLLREAVDYRIKLDANQGDLRTEFNRANDERKRLAARLDQAEGRVQTTQQITKDVSTRLGDAMEVIRTVLENQAR
ncbi:MAG: hypothetical protein COA52_07655 [Hyphomicrobiales bacterium]|nr:MAG: hypothetical protein COA52_07655 [Hyphomicrobiales bacterium]